MAETLSDWDLRHLVTVIEDGRRDEPNRAMPWAVLDGLLDLIRCDAVGFTEFDKPHKVFLTEQFLEGHDERTLALDNDQEPDHPYWLLHQDFLPCSYAARTGDLTRVTLQSDFYTRTELHSTPFVAEVWGGDAPTYRMVATLPAAPGRTRRILLDRNSGPDFSERDRLVLQLLRPHLYEVYLDAQRRLNGVPRLSDRELQVLYLAAQGRRNADIARELFISVSTVRKHMEHIFDRTGTRNRAEAAALVIPHLSGVNLR
jgi:DNA-binding CsgD family transcriptional regulator